jgi:hypothetical protein
MLGKMAPGQELGIDSVVAKDVSRGDAEEARRQNGSCQLAAFSAGGRGVFGGEGVDELYGFDADTHYLADEADDVFFIIRIVGVAGDAAGRRGDSVLIEYRSMTQSSALRFGRCDRRARRHERGRERKFQSRAPATSRIDWSSAANATHFLTAESTATAPSSGIVPAAKASDFNFALRTTNRIPTYRTVPELSPTRSSR